MKYNNKRQIDKSQAIEFLELIHADDDGFITLGTQKNRDDAVMPKHFKGTARFKRALNNCFATKSNVYMSINSCYCPDRKSHNIRKINAIYVDIDCHDGTPTSSIEDLIYSIDLDLIKTNKIPEPNIINLSGRGVHLYWLIEPEYKFKVLLHNAVSRSVCNVLSHYLKNQDSSYTVDHAISQDIVRYMRIPGTYNQNSGTMCVSSISHTKRYTLAGLQEDYSFGKIVDKPKDKPYSRKRSNRPIHLYSKTLHIDGKTIELDLNPPKAKLLYIKRMKDLEVLVNLRLVASKERWCRKRITFLYRHFALCAGYSCKEAWEMTVKLNQGFHTPLRMKILARLSKSAETSYLNGTYYYYKTATIIKMLGISRSEIESLSTLVDDTTLKHRTNAKRRQSYGLRDDNGLTIKQQQMLKARIIIAKCMEDGLTQDEMVAKTGFSLSKVKRLRSNLKAGTAFLRATNSVKDNVMQLYMRKYRRNFNKQYLKLVKSSFSRPSYITFLCSNSAPRLLEQLSMSLSTYNDSIEVNTS